MRRRFNLPTTNLPGADLGSVDRSGSCDSVMVCPKYGRPWKNLVYGYLNGEGNDSQIDESSDLAGIESPIKTDYYLQYRIL